MENSNDVWQTEVNGQIYETNLEGLAQWIAEGSLLPQDKVKRGNLRWIEARKVPTLFGFFNAKELGVAPPMVSTTNPPPGQETVPTQTFSLNTPHQFAAQQQTFNEPPPPQFYQEFAQQTSNNYCAIHKDAKADYVCETCSNYFCRACPLSGMCPMCGANCQRLEAPKSAQPILTPPPTNQNATVEFIDEDVKKGANWFYWKAVLTVLNGFIMLFGASWAFFLGATITQVFHGVADELSIENGTSSVTSAHGIVFVIALVCAGILSMLGHYAGKAKKWAFIVGLIIYAFDGVIYLLTGSIFGIIIHGIAIYMIIKGMLAIKK